MIPSYVKETAQCALYRLPMTIVFRSGLQIGISEKNKANKLKTQCFGNGICGLYRELFLKEQISINSWKKLQYCGVSSSLSGKCMYVFLSDSSFKAET